VLARWLSASGVDPDGFDLFSSPFVANDQGFDKVLDQSQVDSAAGTVSIKDSPTSPTVTQQTTLTYDTSAGSLTVASATTASNGTTSSSNTTLVPTKPALQAAIDGANAVLARVADTMTTKAAALTNADLAPFLTDDFLSDGDDKALLTAR